MELRQLRHFVAVAEELHFGRAAQRLNISQPPLSQSIRRLEDELGAPLLARTSRSVTLTPEGGVFLPEARAILARADHAARAVGLMARGDGGMLRIGLVGPALEGGRLPCLIRAFCQESPQVRVQLDQLNSMEQLAMLREGRLDVGVVRLFQKHAKGLVVRHYASEPYVLALPEGHRLAARAVVPLADLDGEPLLIFQRHANPQLYDAIVGAFSEAGVCPDLLHVSLVKHTTTALVAAGLGVTLLPRGMVSVPRAGVHIRPLEGRLPLVTFSVAWNPENETPLVRRFVEAVLTSHAEGCAPGPRPSPGP
ncbi:LysR substrate-binding domain-containing protein [Desulfocurvus sp.]|jgi:DNA-binding transcriptional LysR family regulator|uniref:LysR substrate-binding domain-containing protein n=1 Tax=Desulfocurvus sp. TaxID=2871698 RepID=UPI0025BD3D41|nr:LysR substrate-binding domain-containing protein [Desulfocurvus sp.]MCK9239474.1 LysR substrate-binding domain-containing protein [Desulfocurvus sp.]